MDVPRETEVGGGEAVEKCIFFWNDCRLLVVEGAGGAPNIL